jgi:hypothetical protein
LPIHKIETNEYECRRCNYKWVNRINGIDGDVPLRCARCKLTTWNKISNYKIYGLRRRVNNLKRLYENNIPNFNWPVELTEQFLSLPPTTKELQQVLVSAKLQLNPQNQHVHYDGIRDKENRLRQDAQRICGVMQRTIESRSAR